MFIGFARSLPEIVAAALWNPAETGEHGFLVKGGCCQSAAEYSRELTRTATLSFSVAAPL